MTCSSNDQREGSHAQHLREHSYSKHLLNKHMNQAHLQEMQGDDDAWCRIAAEGKDRAGVGTPRLQLLLPLSFELAMEAEKSSHQDRMYESLSIVAFASFESRIHHTRLVGRKQDMTSFLGNERLQGQSAVKSLSHAYQSCSNRRCLLRSAIA